MLKENIRPITLDDVYGMRRSESGVVQWNGTTDELYARLREIFSGSPTLASELEKRYLVTEVPQQNGAEKQFIIKYHHIEAGLEEALVKI